MRGKKITNEDVKKLVALIESGKHLMKSLKMMGYNQRTLDSMSPDDREAVYSALKRKKFKNYSARVTTTLYGNTKELFKNEMINKDLKESELLLKIVKAHYSKS